MQLFRVRNF